MVGFRVSVCGGFQMAGLGQGCRARMWVGRMTGGVSFSMETYLGGPCD